jgi:drug/metabolite transporter (DMT)-like permease
MPAARNPDRLKADLVLLGATLGWGATFAVVKGALDSASPNSFLTARFAIGTLVAALFARSALRDRASLRAGAILGFWLWLGFVLSTWGLKFTSATRSGFITSLCVVLVPVFGALFFRARAHLSAWVGAGLAACGLVVLSAPALLADTAGPRGLLGDGITLLSALAFTFHVLFTGRYAPHVQASAAVTAQLAVVTALSALGIPFEDVRFVPTPELAGALFFTGVFASALFLFMQLWAQARTSPVRAALVFSLEPIFAAGFAWLLVHDRFAPEVFLGGAFILCGILVAELWPRLEARRASPAAQLVPPEA